MPVKAGEISCCLFHELDVGLGTTLNKQTDVLFNQLLERCGDEVFALASEAEDDRPVTKKMTATREVRT